MEMKKVAFVVLFAATFISAVMAHHHHPHHHHAAAPSPTPAPAPAPEDGRASGAASLASFVGASLLSFIAYYLHLQV